MNEKNSENKYCDEINYGLITPFEYVDSKPNGDTFHDYFLDIVKELYGEEYFANLEECFYSIDVAATIFFGEDRFCLLMKDFKEIMDYREFIEDILNKRYYKHKKKSIETFKLMTLSYIIGKKAHLFDKPVCKKIYFED